MKNVKLEGLQKKYKDLSSSLEAESGHGQKLSEKLASLKSRSPILKKELDRSKENREKALSDLAISVISQEKFDQIKGVCEHVEKEEGNNLELVGAVNKAIETSRNKIEVSKYEFKRLEDLIWREAFESSKIEIIGLIGDKVRELYIVGVIREGRWHLRSFPPRYMRP